MFDLKRFTSAGILGSVLSGSTNDRPRSFEGGSGRESAAEEEGPEEASNERTATSNLISAGHESFELIFMMLMGIRTCVGRFCAQAQARELTAADFEQKWEGDFLARGSAETPAHGHHDFRFKDYAPLVFRQIRERFGIEAPDYMLSLTHHSRLKYFRPFLLRLI
jgi:1-phosphatidylinositol-4-phosphate 5-kinase